MWNAERDKGDPPQKKRKVTVSLALQDHTIHDTREVSARYNITQATMLQYNTNYNAIKHYKLQCYNTTHATINTLESHMQNMIFSKTCTNSNIASKKAGSRAKK